MQSDDKTTALDEAAALLRAAGWEVTPPRPAAFKVGDRVRYTRSIEWGPDRGDVGTIVEVRQPSGSSILDRVNIFWVQTDNWPGAQFWTTPSYVEPAA